ncbi:hypothetical protein EV401DRAFT_883750 [Pisolithus croceorrhizus]|nr:hypothetical protein EV401DRAFT_883750 [Pisolithus croceorrhizus]
MQHSFQEGTEEKYVSGPNSEGTAAVPLNLYMQGSATQIFHSQKTDGYDELPNVAAFGQMYNEIATASAVTAAPAFAVQYEFPHGLGTSPMPDSFSAIQPPSLDCGHRGLFAQYYPNNMISPDTPTMQEAPMFAQQTHGISFHGPAGSDVPSGQECSASPLGRKRSRRKERILCSHEGCGREMSRDSLGRHVKEIHRGMKRKKSK